MQVNSHGQTTPVGVRYTPRVQMPITAVVGWAGMGARVGVHVDGTWGVDVDAEGGIEEQEDYHQSQAKKS